ncbi:hypothetical protein B0H63DRAFT_140524 [Podospora didyma]|uniref:Uncharacterized protein n=1 Tax=Podospora didyma TaxID=330526 RepID=A0AAE0U165_9PEZI|nr:hypothetical protein B0H63DRAFT_140524 [Podospora didyma]
MDQFIIQCCPGIRLGDSRSTVIDAATFVAYGHMVASNPLGEVYVSALSTTLDQVTKTLNLAVTPVLPDPVTSLGSIAARCLIPHDSYAFDFLAFLGDLVQSLGGSETESDRLRLAFWQESPEQRDLSKMISEKLPSFKVIPERSRCCAVSYQRRQKFDLNHHRTMQLFDLFRLQTPTLSAVR